MRGAIGDAETSARIFHRGVPLAELIGAVVERTDRAARREPRETPVFEGVRKRPDENTL